MKQYFARIACLSLPLVLAGCAHKHVAQTQPPLAPPVDDGPISVPNNAPKNLPPPVVTVPPPKPATTAQTQEEQKPAPKRKKNKPRPDTEAHTNAPAQSSQQALNPTPEVSAIGQLSTGEPADLRTSTVNSLNSTERGLKNLHRRLSYQEEKTAAQIREYIKQARAALASNDLDGANTLATKAKLLLAELAQ